MCKKGVSGDVSTDTLELWQNNNDTTIFVEYV